MINGGMKLNALKSINGVGGQNYAKITEVTLNE